MCHGSISPLLLGSLEAVRPVFTIVMGAFLMLIAWRLSQVTSGWTARFIVVGALLLGCGYMILMPMYEAKAIELFSKSGRYQGSAATATAWHCVKLVMMNGGWLFFGIGLALHAKIFTAPAAPRRTASPVSPPTRSPHEFVA